ncbi:outer membrane protein assembly factor BamB [Mycoavidus sp. B2-EB]|uniref:outer membrane protein assembly factor BamB n=1 Tax=Mycoavidus sp. B2-EB TaxID=2651972 RepID=UPI00162565C2|nr:outer membrane protein assembly factor BamB [Mycoavidus sp. B2-EB]BBO59460.1 outer membrane protein assembly factor BamB [Mycoavidus sp. B2-EB]
MTYLLRLLFYPCACILAALLFTACSSSKDLRRVPSPLPEITPTLGVAQIWKASVGKGNRYLFQPLAFDDVVYAAGANGVVAKFAAHSGEMLWSTKLDAELSAGVGGDGAVVAVASLNGTVHVLDAHGKLLWQAQARGEILTPPLVGQGKVFVRTTDSRIIAFDLATGAQKWVFYNRAPLLSLRTSAGMTFAGTGALLAGFADGSLAVLNLANGLAYWQTPVAYASGVTEVERLNDVTGAPTLVDYQTCAVTFQGRLSCFNVQNGQPLWERPFSSYRGIAQDKTALVASDDASVVSLYDAADGKLLWQNTKLKNRSLGTPILTGQAIVVGDYRGFVHFLSREQGALVARMETDHSAISAQPVLVKHTLIVQTRNGNLYAFRSK